MALPLAARLFTLNVPRRRAPLLPSCSVPPPPLTVPPNWLPLLLKLNPARRPSLRAKPVRVVVPPMSSVLVWPTSVVEVSSRLPSTLPPNWVMALLVLLSVASPVVFTVTAPFRAPEVCPICWVMLVPVSVMLPPLSVVPRSIAPLLASPM